MLFYTLKSKQYLLDQAGEKIGTADNMYFKAEMSL